MNVERARRLVIADQREGFPKLTDAEAIAHVHDVLCLPGTPHTRSTDEVQMDGSELADAYCTVLRHTPAKETQR